MIENDRPEAGPADFANGVGGAGDRRVFLRSAAAAAGMIVGGATLAQAAKPKTRVGTNPAAITASRTRPRPTPKLPELYPNSNSRQFHQIRADENAHVQLLVTALGANARPAPTFTNLEMPDIFTFVQTSYVLENTGVSAYLGAAPLLNSKAYLAAAGSILGIEARHSGYLGVLINNTMDLFSPVDMPATIPIVLQNASPFLQTGSSLNGGPPLTFGTTPSDANDVMILNFALALEYLEADFYNINVPKFFPGG